jgi:hypothetical protein
LRVNSTGNIEHPDVSRKRFDLGPLQIAARPELHLGGYERPFGIRKDDCRDALLRSGAQLPGLQMRASFGFRTSADPLLQHKRDTGLGTSAQRYRPACMHLENAASGNRQLPRDCLYPVRSVTMQRRVLGK